MVKITPKCKLKNWKMWSGTKLTVSRDSMTQEWESVSSVFVFGPGI